MPVLRRRRPTGSRQRGKVEELATGDSAFQVRIPVTDKSVMLRPEEDTLAVLKWRLQEMSPINRWHAVLDRYVSYVAARVNGLGGDADSIPPSLGGAPNRHHHKHRKYPHEDCREYTGKVAGVMYDRFGDFDGFVLRAESGEEHPFRGCEHEVEDLVRRAWSERWVVRVTVRQATPSGQAPSSCSGLLATTRR